MKSRARLVLASAVAFVAAASAFAADKIRIVDADVAAKQWVPLAGKPLVAAPYPALADKSRDVCVNLGYRINKDGSTSDLGVLRVWSSGKPAVDGSAKALQPFVQSAAAAVSMWKFEATPEANKNGMVYTSAPIAFVGAKGTPAGEVRQHCQVVDLGRFIAQAQQKALRRGDANTSDVDRYQRGAAAQRPVAPPEGWDLLGN
jgi:hypothetical protein